MHRCWDCCKVACQQTVQRFVHEDFSLVRSPHPNCGSAYLVNAKGAQVLTEGQEPTLVRQADDNIGSHGMMKKIALMSATPRLFQQDDSLGSTLHPKSADLECNPICGDKPCLDGHDMPNGFKELEGPFLSKRLEVDAAGRTLTAPAMSAADINAMADAALRHLEIQLNPLPRDRVEPMVVHSTLFDDDDDDDDVDKKMFVAVKSDKYEDEDEVDALKGSAELYSTADAAAPAAAASTAPMPMGGLNDHDQVSDEEVAKRTGESEQKLLRDAGRMLLGAHASALTQEQLEAAFLKLVADEAGAKISRKIIICGAPASGKGTQAAMLVEKYGLAHVNSGMMLQQAMAAGTADGAAAKALMDADNGHGERVGDRKSVV